MPSLYVPIMYASGYSVFIPILAGAVRYKTLVRVQRVLFYYLITAAITDIASLMLRYRSETALQATQNLFTLSEYIFLFRLFYLELNYRIVRAFILCSFLVCVLTFILSFYKIDLFFFRNDLTTSVEAIFIVILSILFFVLKNISDEKVPGLLEYPFFYMNTGLAIYFATALVIFINNNYLVNHEEEFRFYHTIQRIINLMSNLLFAFALWVRKRA